MPGQMVHAGNSDFLRRVPVPLSSLFRKNEEGIILYGQLKRTNYSWPSGDMDLNRGVYLKFLK